MLFSHKVGRLCRPALPSFTHGICCCKAKTKIMSWESIKSQAGNTCNHAAHQWLQETMLSLENHRKQEPEIRSWLRYPKGWYF